jgi:hypothetical protein
MVRREPLLWRWVRREVLSLLLGVLSAAPADVTAASQPPPPPLSTRRYSEDYAYLRDPAARTGAWWEPFKYIPLHGGSTGDVYLTTGLELRARYEGYHNNLWGEAPAPDDSYLWLRAMPLADLHFGPHFRLFGQLIAAFAEGVEPNVSPVDEDRLDLLQGFADLRLPLGTDSTVTLRGGRQLLAYGSERLIGLRYGPNVLRAFDGVAGILETGEWQVDALYARPVTAEVGVFDDETDDATAVWALYATRRLPFGKQTGMDLYYIGYDHERAAFNQGQGTEHRHTLGVRFFGQAGGWEWNWEAFYQGGEFARGTIHAWSVASDTGYTFTAFPFTPRVGLKANVISGDDDPHDRDLQTFNALFPKGKYFGELSPLGPANLLHLHPSLAFTLGRGWTLAGAAPVYWRESLHDGIYDLAGNLLRSDGGTRARYIGVQVEVTLTYEHSRTLDVLLAYAEFHPGAFIASTGPSRTIQFMAVETRLWF